MANFLMYTDEYKRENNTIVNSVITTEYTAPFRLKMGTSTNNAKRLIIAPKPTALVLNSCLKEVVSISVKEVAKTLKNRATHSILVNCIDSK